MKYIKTKDGRIIDTLDERGKVLRKAGLENIIEVGGDHIIVKTINGNELIPTEYIVKQANTVKELCDRYVVVSEFDKKVIRVNELENDSEGWTKEVGIPEHIVDVYGAIWTDKGLIYVAKMNSEGELELL